MDGKGTLMTLEKVAITNDDGKTVVEVPASSLNAYKRQGWKKATKAQAEAARDDNAATLEATTKE
jgi:hypothetical protein